MNRRDKCAFLSHFNSRFFARDTSTLVFLGKLMKQPIAEEKRFTENGNSYVCS